MGSEFIYGKLGHCRMAGGWKPIPLPGGSIANIEPWRIPLAIFKEMLPGSLNDLEIPLIKRVRKNNNFNYIFNAIDNKDIDFTLSSSMHHIMSAIGELLSFEEATYDLDFFEKMIDRASETTHSTGHYDLDVVNIEGMPQIDTGSLFQQLYEDLHKNPDGGRLIIKAVESIALATAKMTLALSEIYNEKKVFICGETWKNAGFLKLVISKLTGMGLHVYLPRNIPIDDSSVSVGQILHYLFNKKLKS